MLFASNFIVTTHGNPPHFLPFLLPEVFPGQDCLSINLSVRLSRSITMAAPPPPGMPVGAAGPGIPIPMGPGGPPGPGQPMQMRVALPPGMRIEPGQQPTPEQMEQIKAYNMQQKQLFEAKVAEQAAKEGVPVETVLQRIQQQRVAMMQRMQMQQQQGQGQPGAQQGGPQGQPLPQHPAGAPPAGVQQPITPGPPNPVAIALANFLRGQNLKTRTCILNGERKDMFRGAPHRLTSPVDLITDLTCHVQ